MRDRLPRHNKPTGRLRTWPNAMLYEAVRGMESSSMKQRAHHQTILPFARYLAGPTDYTTMIFTQRQGFVLGTPDRLPGDLS